ncbi:peptidase [Rhizoctonia solani]|uniref:Peptidase n=1 Tax=Rhizoctonia solani TaxID=456999 RepID=A0A8H7IPB2_9AGAM|nr:peptidase [Rhizoctonia solani]
MYVTKLKDGVSKDSHIAKLLSSTSDSKIEYKYEQVFHGYAAELKGKDLDYVRQSSDVEYILEDGIFTIQYETAVEPVGQLSKRANGSGVDVYGVDTGIYTAHSSFGGRARWGATYGGVSWGTIARVLTSDTAATAVGNTYGVATSANVIAVKANSALDSAITTAIGKGIHFTVAAGNSNVDAANTSPARVAAANTIGAVDSSNRKASFSNYGRVLDAWALGVNVLSAWIGSTTATNTISGTSMATPFVAGVLAVAIGDYGNKSPAELSADLKSHARAVVTGAPSGTTNLLATKW